ncbi:hypothetical protein LOTGIDRAFT_162918 [Lottia gigantea]|uniref:Uncharacterized protein n=1 Tax=Lottia gigantea TaxID=225164 RepID=V4AAZ0_LOTGI|nr:hypothetical protein LOTGIDRAFT_162918 [Lottia gigantea]ESO92265.1 hypothetical protein LOTGIDRAFT_162918 [Lottia gigantea]
MADVKAQAEEIKQKGNAAYKKKDFETALKHYDEAFAIDGTNITILTNKAAVFFEQGEYDKCIETCEKAVEVGRENRADYALLAKALARIGNSYLKKEDLKNALVYFNKSLLENRTQEIVKKQSSIKRNLSTFLAKVFFVISV